MVRIRSRRSLTAKRGLIVALVAVQCAVACGRVSADCADQLREVRRVPFKREAIEDLAYNDLVEAGPQIVPCLIEQLTDTETMTDPRQAPTYDGFVVGDLAHILLVDITKIPFDEFLPKGVRDKQLEQGVYAYFEYVEDNLNRPELQGKWKTWWAQHGSRELGGRG